jgi:hypothetical protein
VNLQANTNVLKEHSASIFRADMRVGTRLGRTGQLEMMNRRRWSRERALTPDKCEVTGDICKCPIVMMNKKG